MNSNNIAVVFAPTLMRPLEIDLQEIYDQQKKQVFIIKTMIDYYQEIFHNNNDDDEIPVEIDFSEINDEEEENVDKKSESDTEESIEIDIISTSLKEEDKKEAVQDDESIEISIDDEEIQENEYNNTKGTSSQQQTITNSAESSLISVQYDILQRRIIEINKKKEYEILILKQNNYNNNNNNNLYQNELKKIQYKAQADLSEIERQKAELVEYEHKLKLALHQHQQSLYDTQHETQTLRQQLNLQEEEESLKKIELDITAESQSENIFEETYEESFEEEIITAAAKEYDDTHDDDEEDSISIELSIENSDEQEALKEEEEEEEKIESKIKQAETITELLLQDMVQTAVTGNDIGEELHEVVQEGEYDKQKTLLDQLQEEEDDTDIEDYRLDYDIDLNHFDSINNPIEYKNFEFKTSFIQKFTKNILSVINYDLIFDNLAYKNEIISNIKTIQSSMTRNSARNQSNSENIDDEKKNQNLKNQNLSQYLLLSHYMIELFEKYQTILQKKILKPWHIKRQSGYIKLGKKLFQRPTKSQFITNFTKLIINTQERHQLITKNMKNSVLVGPQNEQIDIDVLLVNTMTKLDSKYPLIDDEESDWDGQALNPYIDEIVYEVTDQILNQEIENLLHDQNLN